MIIALYILVLVVVSAIIMITLLLNTKSEGLGAAITGASDSYRGAVGVEEQKRTLLKVLCYTFIGLAFLTVLMQNWF